MTLDEQAPPTTTHAPTGRLRVLSELQTFRALKNPHYRMLWVGMLFAFLTMNIQQVARSWLAYDLTGSARALALVAISWGAPMVIFSLPGGLAADRFEKKHVMMVSQLAGAVTALVIAVLVALDVIEIWHLIVGGFIQGTGFAFNLPARQSVVRELVSDSELMNAVALNNAGMNLMRILGPSVAGLLIAVPNFGVQGVYFLMTGFYIAAAVTLARLPKTRRERLVREGAPAGRPGSPVAQMKAGLAYVVGNADVRTLMVLAFVPILVGFPYQILLPVFAAGDGIDVGARGYGAMAATVGVGALIGSLVIASLTEFHRRALLQAFMGVGFGVALLLLGFSPTLFVAVIPLLVLGFCADAYSSLNNTMLMMHTDPKYQGRVMSVYLMTFAAMPLGAAPISALADIAGVRQTFVGMGVIVAGFIGAVALLYPRYRRIS